jgi:hypothetical protein
LHRMNYPQDAKLGEPRGLYVRVRGHEAAAL